MRIRARQVSRNWEQKVIIIEIPNIMVGNDLRNAFRYPGKGAWFDFWNCRVLIPEKNMWFFVMPLINSTQNSQNSYFFYSSSEMGSVVRKSIEDPIDASTSGAGLTWDSNCFTPGKIDINLDNYHWNFTIQRLCTDGEDYKSDPRSFNVGERLLLRNNSFIHRVPTMKGFANGYIQTPEEKIELKNAIVYQAKNHGKDFPNKWLWLHANDIPQFPNASFEIGLMPDENGASGIFRWAENDETNVYATYLGDKVIIELENDNFTFNVEDENGKEVMRGTAAHGDKNMIVFPTPRNEVFQTPESFNGQISGYYQGEYFQSDHPAIGIGEKTKN